MINHCYSSSTPVKNDIKYLWFEDYDKGSINKMYNQPILMKEARLFEILRIVNVHLINKF